MKDHVSDDMPFIKLKEICAFFWKDKFRFLVIDKDCTAKSKRYGSGFGKFINIYKKKFIKIWIMVRHKLKNFETQKGVEGKV